jgi:hypothetical protein
MRPLDEGTSVGVETSELNRVYVRVILEILRLKYVGEVGDQSEITEDKKRKKVQIGSNGELYQDGR